VINSGYLTHELVVLPLPANQPPGARPVRADGTVDEAGSRGEASAGCASGAGDGIAAGSAGWVTLHLPAGRYELICNLPGHYAAGMYTGRTSADHRLLRSGRSSRCGRHRRARTLRM
jgi:uncharacterized cupredoxin-like copper-binding protein